MYKDWIDAVAKGDTKLGFSDWCLIQRQIEGDVLHEDTSPHKHEMDIDEPSLGKSPRRESQHKS
jgi:hypothetical protein